MSPQRAVPITESVHSYSRENEANNWPAEDADRFIVGDRVWVGGSKAGVVAFVGETQFGSGDWAGVVLDEPTGKNDGSLAGVRYFQCAPNKGIFARLARLSRSPLDFGSTHAGRPTTTRHPSTDSPSYKNSTSFEYASSSIDERPVDRSHKSLDSAHLNGSEVKLGDRVIVQSSHGSKAGILRYYGNTEFENGFWCGVELDEPLGKNDGTVAGVRYFECEPKFGIFVPSEKVSRSPISRAKSPACVIHPEGISRQSTSESMQTCCSGIKNKRAAVAQNTNGSASKSPQQIRVVKVYYPDWETEYY